MGLYLEVDSKGTSLGAKGKADKLIADGAREVDGKTYEPFLVCVVDNGPFEAAGFCFSRAEFAAFAHPDGRPRRWLVAERACKRNFRPSTIDEHLDDYKVNKGQQVAIRHRSKEEFEQEVKSLLGEDVKIFYLNQSE